MRGSGKHFAFHRDMNAKKRYSGQRGNKDILVGFFNARKDPLHLPSKPNYETYVWCPNVSSSYFKMKRKLFQKKIIFDKEDVVIGKI